MAAMKLRWWEWWPWRRWRIVGEVDAADNIPTRLPRNAAVLVGTRQAPKWLSFDCPCRSGHRIVLNLDRSRWPHWRIGTGRRMTLSPSVDSSRPQGRCHYLITGGRV